MKQFKHDLLFIKLITVSLFFFSNAQAGTFTVTRNDYASNAATGNIGDLRWAFAQVNASAGPHTINFAIGAASSLQTITMTNSPGPLPAITSQNVTIDGWSQYSGGVCTGNPIIEISGPGFGNGIFATGANGFILQGVIINKYQDPVRLTTSSNCSIRGCWIGTNNTGTAAIGGVTNNAGIYIVGPSSFNFIGGNIITNPCYKNIISNCRGGIQIDNSTDNTIQGNYIGTDKTGNNTIANTSEAIFINTGSHRNLVGGLTNGDENIAGLQTSANNNCAIYINGSNDDKVYSNRVGLSLNGTVFFNTGFGGIYVNNCLRSVIGSASAFQPNYVVTGSGSASSYRGIYINSSCDSTIVYNTYVGTNGTTVSGRFGTGIEINSSTKNYLGGTAAGQAICVVNTNYSGIKVNSGCTTTRIEGSYIGVTPGNVAFGNGTSGGNHGIEIAGTSAMVINNNVICNSFNCGIDISGIAGNSVITGNKIGTDITGMSCMSNLLHGIRITSSNGHTIGGTTAAKRNIISGNGSTAGTFNSGMYLDGVSNSTIQGNFIGTDASGNAILTSGCNAWTNPTAGGVAGGNEVNGLYMKNGSTNNMVGGTVAGSGNVFGGNGYGENGWFQALQFDGAPGNFVYGNYIGLGIDGTSSIPNVSGVSCISTTNNLIGGGSAGQRNYISNNSTWGVLIQGGSANHTLGNYIGTDITGSLNRGNGLSGYNHLAQGGGVGYINGATGNYIGRANPGEGNLISFNKMGIALSSLGGGGGSASSNFVQNNIIQNSANSPGTQDAQIYGWGIAIDGSGNSNQIGSTVSPNVNPLEPNIITNNYKGGIFITTGNNNSIRQNSIYCNGTPTDKGINLNGSGNSNYTTPTIIAGPPGPPAGSDSTQLIGTAPANSIVEIFLTEPCATCTQASPIQVEGKTWLATVTANGAGVWKYPAVPISSSPYLNGSYTATATASNSGAANTSEFSICDFETPLPVALLSFTASLKDNEVTLYWNTVYEKNNDYFIIERSTDGGKSFQDIGRVLGKGNSAKITNYSFVDANVSSSMVYYRLKQTDYNGTITRSNIVAVNINADGEIKIYPNPTNRELTVEMSFNASAAYELILYNMLGVQVFSFSGNISSGFDSKTIDLKDFSCGIYFLHFTTSDKTLIEKLVKN